MERRPNAFIDSSLIHSALAALIAGAKDQRNDWDSGSLLEVTYLLMNGSVGTVPGPGQYGGATGYYATVLSAFPEIEDRKFDRKLADRSTRAWLNRYPEKLQSAWNQLQEDAQFHAWWPVQREMFWSAHVQMHRALFNSEYITQISRILDCSEGELQKIHQLSQDVQVVKKWSRLSDSSDVVQIATQSWLLSALIRGKYHEYIARNKELQLIPHRFRTGIGKKVGASLSQPVFASEEFLVRAIIGGAFLETNIDRRVAAWVGNISKTRMALTVGSAALPDSITQLAAESAAIDAARSIGITSSRTLLHRAFDTGLSFGAGTLVSISVSPWAGGTSLAYGYAAKALSSLALQTYRHKRGQSAGEDLAKLMFSTKRRFRKLIRNVPGRIEREIRLKQSASGKSET